MGVVVVVVVVVLVVLVVVVAETLYCITCYKTLHMVLEKIL